jgi:hypothetical protein
MDVYPPNRIDGKLEHFEARHVAEEDSPLK